MKKTQQIAKNKIFLFISIEIDRNVEKGRNFKSYSVNINGSDLRRITFYFGFEGYPVFSLSDKYLVFPSNRNQKNIGDTKLCLVERNHQ